MDGMGNITTRTRRGKHVGGGDGCGLVGWRIDWLFGGRQGRLIRNRTVARWLDPTCVVYDDAQGRAGDSRLGNALGFESCAARKKNERDRNQQLVRHPARLARQTQASKHSFESWGLDAQLPFLPPSESGLASGGSLHVLRPWRQLRCFLFCTLLTSSCQAQQRARYRVCAAFSRWFPRGGGCFPTPFIGKALVVWAGLTNSPYSIAAMRCCKLIGWGGF